ncbi:hypothetical protein W97_06527 [Coniosporium apollinis CBS 100218]|uniref:Uncharacterized protein n=1 Tax=Coniosporium apollinis (strain CBS 100218) TaxID=1168221 RepID=R7YZQ5_CONA1|nr:uncharacterized protein W97_06527 [Coniosporium apollinis CBS 100218]EON67274.1 hypothetical protein W97_06527 [Coniosporium apollinis CBS 100218]
MSIAPYTAERQRAMEDGYALTDEYSDENTDVEGGSYRETQPDSGDGTGTDGDASPEDGAGMDDGMGPGIIEDDADVDYGDDIFVDWYNDRNVRAKYAHIAWVTLRAYRSDLRPWTHTPQQCIWDTNNPMSDGSLFGQCVFFADDSAQTAASVRRIVVNGRRKNMNINKFLAFGCGTVSLAEWRSLVMKERSLLVWSLTRMSYGRDHYA